MGNECCPIEWTEEQWNQVQETVRSEAAKVRVAGSFLPIYGPLPCDAESVPIQEVRQEPTGETHVLAALANEMRRQADAGAQNLPQVLRALEGNVRAVEHSAARRRGEAQERLMVDDTRCRPLTKISVNVYLTSAQLCQPDLASALILFRRAANLISRVEDRIVFGGQPGPDPEPRLLNISPPIFRVSGGAQFRGLIAEALAITPTPHCTAIPPGPNPQYIVTAVANAIADLEEEGHLSPFALVLGSNLFIMAHNPSPSLVLPADRIKPLLGGGPLLRSTTIPPDEGVLVSQSGELIDLVRANDISAKYLQTTLEPRHVFRVSQRMTLRVKQPGAIMALQPNCP
ncbi:MAG: bacteriocin family protein [Nitrospirales bacterium]|nr:bacteriocin family protein [Nitrospirales bacterium]